MERTTLEVIAPSVEEAVARGAEQLGVAKELLDVEILDEGAKGFLGFGSRDVRVRLALRETDAPQTTPTLEKPQTAPVASASLPQAGDDLLRFAEQNVKELLLRMKVTAQVQAAYGETEPGGETPVLINIHGEDLSVLIGRRAETLNALQYIIALIISKEAGHWVQVLVDVEGYRARREKQLRQLAVRMAEQTIRTGKRQTLEPMSAAERRVIHLELRNHAEVVSESTGEEPNRKVTIRLK